MAHEYVRGFASDNMEVVDVEGDTASGYSVIDGYEPRSPSHCSSTGSNDEAIGDPVNVCQCPRMVFGFSVCQVCGSFFWPGTLCPCLPLVK